MRDYLIYADCHKYSKFQSHTEFEDGSIMLGDNIDAAGAHKSEVYLAEKEVETHIIKRGHKFICGNHELRLDRIKDQYVTNNILFTHGHLEFWGWKKSVKYIKKSPGKGFFGRFTSWFFDSVRSYKKLNMSDEQKDRCWQRCIDYNCHTIVLGHKHPKEVTQFLHTINGKTIRIFVLPRGMTRISL